MLHMGLEIKWKMQVFMKLHHQDIMDSIQQQAKEVPVIVKNVRVNCYAIVTILALVMAVLSLIVALVGVSHEHPAR